MSWPPSASWFLSFAQKPKGLSRQGDGFSHRYFESCQGSVEGRRGIRDRA